MPVMYAEEGLGHGVTLLSPSEKNFAPDSGIHSNLDIDLAEFDFATGVIGSEDEAEPGEASGLAGISERTDNKSIGFTDAMAVRPRTNERPSSTQQKYMDMYERSHTPMPSGKESLVGFELEIGPDEPQSARSGDSLLTMSSMNSISVRESVATMQSGSKGSKVSLIPFLFPLVQACLI